MDDSKKAKIAIQMLLTLAEVENFDLSWMENIEAIDENSDLAKALSFLMNTFKDNAESVFAGFCLGYSLNVGGSNVNITQNNGDVIGTAIGAVLENVKM